MNSYYFTITGHMESGRYVVDEGKIGKSNQLNEVTEIILWYIIIQTKN